MLQVTYDDVLLYTPIDNEYKVKLDSKLTSQILDDPRDAFQFIIMFILCIWFIVLLEFFDDNEFQLKEAWTYLSLAIFGCIGYFVDIFVCGANLSQHLFHYNDQELDYWEQTRFI